MNNKAKYQALDEQVRIQRRNKSVTLVYYVNIPSRFDSLVKSIVYKVHLKILQVPGIGVNSHVAVIFLVRNAYICNVKSDWL